MPKVSIIVPVYNVEPYLRRCIDSIFAQSFADFELILVDDGSTDACGSICDEYARIDKRVRVIHQNNHGAASARNTGIENAKGEYLAFCDGDDTVSPMWLERMVKLVAPDKLPIGAHCGDVRRLGQYKDLQIEIQVDFPRENYYMFNCKGIAGYLWNALYRRVIIQKNNLRFRERKEQGDYNEDLLFALSYVKYIGKIVYTGYADYLYNTHEGSVSRANQKYYFEKYAEKFRLWREFIERECVEQEDQLRALATTTLYQFLTALRWQNRMEEISKIALSEEMEKCLSWADTSRENPYEIKLLQEKKIFALYCFYQGLRWKERLHL